jgi:predicted MPP superfamily phosphohydrolase
LLIFVLLFFTFHSVKLVHPFLAGLFYIKNTAIYVNKGVGTWGINFRYKANAEITILKLISKTVE